MNVDRILSALNRHRVRYLLIGGMNYLLRHEPIVTYDVDIWIEDSEANLRRAETALATLKAEWGRSAGDWGPVARRRPGWLKAQAVFCLTTPQGALDLFRRVTGLRDWRRARAAAVRGKTGAGVPFYGLSDADMLRCQRALGRSERKPQRVLVLEKAVRRGKKGAR